MLRSIKSVMAITMHSQHKARAYNDKQCQNHNSELSEGSCLHSSSLNTNLDAASVLVPPLVVAVQHLKQGSASSV
jgi:hypothetical protein